MSRQLTAVAIVVGLLSYGAIASAQTFDAPDPVVDQVNAGQDPGEVRLEQDRLGWAVPDFARLSTGGWIGSVNASIGYAIFDDILNVSAGYGFTPAREAGTPVHNADVTLAVRPIHLDFEEWDWYLVPVEVGASALYVFGDEYEVQFPERYSSGYYRPTALHWLAHVGIEAGYLPDEGFITRHALYYRAATVDTFVTAYFDNRDRLGLSDVVSSAVGYRAAW
jgi:hypothetical protein